MTRKSLAKQRGATVLGMLGIGLICVLVLVIAVQVVPTILEYVAVKKAVQRAAQGLSEGEARAIFNKAAQMDNIRAIQAQDLQVNKEGERLVVSFRYVQEIHLLGPAYLALHYSGRAKLGD